MNDLLDTRVYSIIGKEGFERLTCAFYRRVAADGLLGPMYRESLEHSGETLEHARVRLRDFLIQRFGGPQTYSEARGHPRLRARHIGFPIDHTAAQRWLELMTESLDESDINAEARPLMDTFFADAAAFMINT